MNNILSSYLQFTKVDRALWLGMLAIAGVAIILLSLFTTTSLFYWLERFLITVLIMFLPGYAIMKLFFDGLTLSDYPVLDKFLMSVFFSIASVQTLYFLLTYLRTYGFNVDEDVISSDKIAIAVALLVIAAAFGVKFYLNKKRAASP